MRPQRQPFAGGAGSAAAAVHFAGALKSLPGVAALPVDLTVAAAAALLPLLLLTRRGSALAPGPGARRCRSPAASCCRCGWSSAGSWSASAAVLAEKLPQAALLGPAMLVAGALVGADAAARRGFCSATLGIGLLVGGAVAWGVATDAVVLGGAPGADPARVRVQYQIAGLAIACAAGLAALRLVEARGAAARLAWASWRWRWRWRRWCRAGARRCSGSGSASRGRRRCACGSRAGAGRRCCGARRRPRPGWAAWRCWRRARRGCRTSCGRWSGSSARRPPRRRRGR